MACDFFHPKKVSLLHAQTTLLVKFDKVHDLDCTCKINHFKKVHQGKKREHSNTKHEYFKCTINLFCHIQATPKEFTCDVPYSDTNVVRLTYVHLR